MTATQHTSAAPRGVDIDELPALFDGVIKLARSALGIRAFGAQVIDLPPSYTTDSHDETATGQEELYVALSGDGAVDVSDWGSLALEPGRLVLVPPACAPDASKRRRRRARAGDRRSARRGVRAAAVDRVRGGGTMTATSATAIEQDQVEAFAGRVVGDIAATMSTIFVALGDKLGLFSALASGGPATPAELAQRTATDERYVREWLHGLTANGYLELDRSTGRFSLPAAHAAVLADEGGLWFLGGGYQELAGMLPVLGRIESAFREGGGVPQAAYADDAYDGMARFTRAWFDHRLPGDWLPVLGDLHSRLETGLRWADVGAGAGRAVIRLAELFPASTFVGYDAFPAQVQRARRAAEEAGVGDRVRFEVADAAQGLPEKFDVISTFDVVHDAADPAGLVAGIRRSLADDGTYLMLEINCADDPADNTGPVASVMYGFSVLYCMTTSLAQGGEGLGTCGCPPAVVEALGHAAGFGSVRELEIGDPFNRLYELRA